MKIIKTAKYKKIEAQFEDDYIVDDWKSEDESDQWRDTFRFEDEVINQEDQIHPRDEDDDLNDENSTMSDEEMLGIQEIERDEISR